MTDVILPRISEIAEYYLIIHPELGYYVDGMFNFSLSPILASKFSKKAALSYIEIYLAHRYSNLKLERVCYCVD